METKKSNKANLENRKTLFFQTGLAISLLLVFTAFQWKTLEKKVFILGKGEDINIIDLPDKTEPEKDKTEPTKPKFKELKQSDDVKDQKDIIFEDFKDFKGYDYNFKKPEIPDEPEPKDDNLFVLIADVMPEFPGGEKEMNKYLGNNLKYPDIAVKTGITGTVHISFIVEPDGKLTNITLLKGIGGGCDEEALRVIKGMPDWKPGKQRNMPVRVKISIPIRFTLINQ